MKRYGNLFDSIVNIENIELADTKARKHKKKNWGVKKHDKHRETDNAKLLEELKTLAYRTSPYSTFKIYEPKERIIFRLPYFPDRIVHHAIMNIMEELWTKIFVSHTYSCIKERGIHKVVKDLKKALKKDPDGTKYCLKLDIKKFYPSIDHDILKGILRKKIKDKLLLTILDEVVDSTDGVPIGNYLSQFFANLVLAYFDHWIFEEVKVELAKRGVTLHYFRYADDIVVLSNDNNALREVLVLIKLYLKHILKLSIKSNYQVFKVEERGIDFVGYKFYHSHILLRKSIKQRMFRTVYKYIHGKISLDTFKKRMCSYFGWMKHCDSKNLLRKVEAMTGMHYSNWCGEESLISNFYEENIKVIEVVPYSKNFQIHFVHKNKSYTVKSASVNLLQDLTVNRNFPFDYTLHSNINIYEHSKHYQNLREA